MGPDTRFVNRMLQLRFRSVPRNLAWDHLWEEHRIIVLINTVFSTDLAIRIIISSARYCNKAAIHEECKTASKCRRRVAYRVFIMLGLLINSACAITVFIFTHTQRDLNGDVKFQVPQTIIEDKYNDQRYFQVSQAGSYQCPFCARSLLSFLFYCCYFLSQNSYLFSLIWKIGVFSVRTKDKMVVSRILILWVGRFCFQTEQA